MRDYSKFSFLSDKEGDKIIYFHEGSFRAGEDGVRISHDLGFNPLIIGYWATDANFSDPRGFLSLIIDDRRSGLPIYDVVFATALENDKVSLTDILSSESQIETIYYRVFGFMPTDVEASAAHTGLSAGGNFLINTKYKYSKLFAAGVADGEVTIPHNFGYLPRVLVWSEAVNGPPRVWPIGLGESAGYSYSEQGIIVTNTSVTILDISADKIHYRVYYDEA